MKNAMKLGLMVALAAAVGCGSGSGPADAKAEGPGKKESKEHGHGHGPNGGVVFDLGKYHAEFTVDHGKAEATVLILGADEKTPSPVAAKELTLTTKETKTKDGKVVPPMTVKLLPKDEANGKASKFVGSDPGIGNVADFEGTVLGEIDGKPSQGEFKE